MEIARRIKNCLVVNPWFAAVFRMLRRSTFYRKIIVAVVKRFDAEIRDSREYTIGIETTNACNASCIFCPIATMRRKKSVMDDETFECLITRIKEDNIRPYGFCVNGTGEPLIDKNIFKRIRRLKQEFPHSILKFHSNFCAATDQMIDEMVTSGLDEVNISINGYDKESYEKIMHLDFDRTMGNVAKLIERRRSAQSTLKIRVSMVLASRNEGYEKDFISRWSAQVDSVSINRVTNYGNTVPEKAGANRIDSSMPVLPCRSLWAGIIIGSNGQVLLCCQDVEGDDDLGNIRDHRILDIYYGDKFEEYRRKHLAGDLRGLTKCVGCSIPHDHGAHWFIRRQI